MKTLSRRAVLRISLIGVAAVVLSGAIVGAASDTSNDGNRLQATFTETRLAVQDRTADLGIRQVILSGTGTVDGFGAATEINAVSFDVMVTPCGPGSSTSTILRRIVVAEGTLVLKTLAHRCPTPTGILATGEYQVDGASSTGVFAGAWGRGSEKVDVAPPPSGAIVVTISGRLHLAESGD
jgi:hypothetical protein